MPLRAEELVPGSRWVVVFDRPLQEGVVAFTNYAVTHNVDDYLPAGARVFGHRVRITGAVIGSFTPPAGISYSAAVPDLIGLNGVPVAAFPKVPFA